MIKSPKRSNRPVENQRSLRSWVATLVDKKKIPRRLPRSALPTALEHKYLKFLLGRLHAYRYRVSDRLSHALPSILSRAAERRTFRRDADADVLEALFAQLELIVGEILDPETMKSELVSLAEEAEKFQAAQANKQIRAGVGLDRVGNE